jgi:hypothetical protein
MSMARDSQRSKVYAWERAVLPGTFTAGGKKISLTKCEALVKRIWRDQGRVDPPPAISDGRGCKRAYTLEDTLIKLPRWARKPEVVIHEIAHALLHRRRVAHDLAAHGPEFVVQYIDLLEQYAGMDRDVLLAMAGEMRVKVDEEKHGLRLPLVGCR